MDKKEILDILDNAKDERGAVPMRLVRQAFDKLVQPEERKESHACDLISRQAAIDAASSLCDDCDSDYCGSCRVNYPGEKDVIKALKDLPSAQPEQR